MSWVDGYKFGGDFADLRGSQRAATLERELVSELSPEHPLYGKNLVVVACALPQDEVVVTADGEVALVHLTYAQHPEPAPWPETDFVSTAADFAALVEFQY